MPGCTAAISRGNSGQPGVTAVLVVIGLVIVQLPFKIALVPKQSPIEVLAPHRPDQPLNESMRTGRTGNCFNLVNFEETKVRKPLMKAKQWIVIWRKDISVVSAARSRD